ncbi:MAG TPA: sensor histidine kinase, partial [Solirubrobacteraceae bacterium]
ALDDPDATVEELREVARSIVESTDRTERLLDGLLLLALSTQGTRRDEPLALDAVVRRGAAAVAAEAAEAGVALRLDLQPARVRGDEVLIERVAANLAENAVRYGRPGGVARVGVREDTEGAVLTVTSDGDVIAPADLDRLGQPFERLRRERARGTGLGLSIVRAVAEAHGGRLRLAAPASGGLVAEVRLPPAAAAVTGA